MKNPFQAKNDLREKVLEQVEYSLPLKGAIDPETWKVFDDFRHGDGKDDLSFVQEPYIEVGREYQRSEYTLKELAEDKGGRLLHPHVAAAFAKYLLEDDEAKAEDVRLYQHQYRSLLEVSGKTKGEEGEYPKNLLVCTGTGSGKTECFLLPLVDHIYREHLAAQENGNAYIPHVRALILYPLNALVNDQVKRLRRLLKYLPEVTFGQYIGTTDRDFAESNVPDALIAEGQKILEQDNGGWQRKVSEENSLRNEWRSRTEWRSPNKGGKGAADILVTNHSMLERLLLQPSSHCDFFDHCWDFIVIDEAHSHSGSVGTEIAWLMRRLTHRLETAPDGEKGKIRFLATSATLSEGESKKEKALDFATSLFPAPRESFAVEFGTYAEWPSRDNAGQSFTESTDDLYRHHEQLFLDTVIYETQREAWKRSRGDVAMMKQVVENGGYVRAGMLFQMRNLFDLLVQSPIPDSAQDDFIVTDVFEYLTKLVLCKVFPRKQHKGQKKESGKPDPLSTNNWRYFLHDAALHAPSALENDTSKVRGRTVRRRIGNRLDVFNKWVSIRKGNLKNECVHYYVFYYLYLALGELIREKELPIDANRFILKISDARVKEFQSKMTKHREMGAELDRKKGELDKEWGAILRPFGEDHDYAALLYRNLARHRDYHAFEEIAAEERPMTTREFSQEAGLDEKALEHLIALGNLAKLSPQIRRHPLIEVRYHQVIRDIADVGIYFEKGDPNCPRFVRNTEEYHDGKEKIFTLGLCRKCGHPYLLGYTEDNLTPTNQVSDIPISRTETGKFKYMHAFSWLEPLPIDDAEEGFPRKADKEYWIDLEKGLVSVSNKSPAKGHWTRMYWGTGPTGESRIEKCKRCGAEPKGLRKLKYGIVTPYEATGDQYRVMVLNAFADLCEENPDAHANSTAGGRKVLAFSDSRGQAARLASAFEETNERRLMDHLVREMVLKANRTGDYDEDTKKKIAYLEAVLTLCPDLKETREKLDELRQTTRVCCPNFTAVLGGLNAEALTEGLKTLHYTQMLEWETSNGEPIADMGLLGKFLLLRALRDPARQGLLAQRYVRLQSAAIGKETKWEMGLISPELGIDKDKARELCQTIYVHLVRQCKVKLPSDFWFTTDDEKKGDYLDRFHRNCIKASQFLSTKIDSAIYGKILAPQIAMHLGIRPDQIPSEIKKNEALTWLQAAWRQFTSVWSFLVGDVGATEFALDFEKLCGGVGVDGDLQIFQTDQTEPNGEPIPYAIEEHTAQVRGEIGAAYQKAFAEGRINILSCSTTFEMGIDVGGLNNIFLSNLPSSSASYRQRAGRAGRRPGASAHILTLAGHGAHDQYYYGKATELFWGAITPPVIYLDKPVFAARHMRAEAMHLFLEYVSQQTSKLKWERISDFIIGWKMQGSYVHPSVVKIQNGSICEQFLDAWRTAQKDMVQAFVEGIEGYESFRRGLAAESKTPYGAADDLAFQLIRRSGDLKAGQEAQRFYQCMGGCRLPEKNNMGSSSESLNPKRLCLKERLLHLLHHQGAQPGDPSEHFPTFERTWPGNGQPPPTIEFAQAKTLMKNTISVLTETCILPRYGFAIDEISLLFDADEMHQEVELSRPLQIGLFEYAPGQVISANKRKYQSWRAAIMRWPNDQEPNPDLAQRLSRRAIFCPECRKLFENAQDSICPQCGSQLKKRRFVTPEAFYAQPSQRGDSALQAMPRGEPIMHWGGGLIQSISVPQTRLSTAESSDRMMQYLNTNYGDGGFFADGMQNLRSRSNIGTTSMGHYYVHEVQTNIAIWEFETPWAVFPPEGYLPNIHYQPSRVRNACQSALYALRAGIALRLGVTPRDIGVLLQDDGGTKIRFVFFDTAAGGGGNALALTMRNEKDQTEASRIRGFIEEAIHRLENDNECGTGEGHVPEQKPIPASLYQTLVEPDKQSFRPASACYGCLKDYDNQRIHAVLDKDDALALLRYLLMRPTGLSLGAIEWEEFDGELVDQWRYYLKDGRVKRYDNVDKPFGVNDVEKQERK